MELQAFEQIKQRPDRPLLCLEVNPPRGVELDPVFKRLEGKLEGIDFLNVTDCALARMKCAAIPFGSMLKQRLGREVMVNISCRDRNLIAIQADLLGGWALGVHSVVALTGDAVTIGDSPERKGVFEVNSIGLLHAINTLNEGKDLANNELKGRPQFHAGVVVNPNARNSAAEIKRLQRKKDAGGRYALSQPIFDPEAAEAFFKEALSVGMPIFLGLLPFKNAQAFAGAAKIPGIKVPENLLEMIGSGDSKDLSSFFIDHCIHIAQRLQPYVAGFHVVSGATPLLALQLATELVKIYK